MIKDLTVLKWKKNIYYISENIIFDIEQRKKKFDIDCCGTYLIDTTLEKIQKAADGTSLDISKNPESFIDKVPYILVEFTEGLKRYFPLQFLIEEGDKVLEDKVIQSHPNVFDNKYINKFNQDIFNFIKNSIKNKELFDPNNVKFIMNSLPDWLTIKESKLMSENYIDRHFLKGSHYNETLARKSDVLYTFKSIKLGIGDDLYPINIWTEEVIKELVRAIDAEKFVNKFNNKVGLKSSVMENIAEVIKEAEQGNNNNSLLTLLNYDNGIVKFESVAGTSDIDTIYEYRKSKDTTKFYSLVKDEESYNADSCGGLKKYYSWSDQANAPYKEDLWNTVENRAANINDARKDSETGEYILDEYGNYIYNNCERCWKGAVNAPGAKYPWIVINVTSEIPSIVKFKYTYPDGSVKEVTPWGNKIFGGPVDEPRREWGCASVATEFNDNDFLISENRKYGGESTFDINRFELILDPVE